MGQPCILVPPKRRLIESAYGIPLVILCYDPAVDSHNIRLVHSTLMLPKAANSKLRTPTNDKEAKCNQQPA